ncbi:cupin domain-containing protein [Paenibacillus sp. CGMCC 1.16610]|nr:MULTISPECIES: cupin domain-containing protein [Paenibacillus]MBA2937312.1 cupin domain-containing protein [Paenibacillus sp. CGMCC 1.16610]
MQRHQDLERHGIHHSHEEMEWFDVLPGEQIAYRIQGKDVNNEYSLFDLRMAAKQGNGPIAIHHKADEIFRIIEGEARFHIGGKEFNAGAGDVLVVPRGTPHAFLNIGDSHLHMSIMFTPPGDELIFKEVHGKSMDEIIELAKKYEVSVVGPPIVYNK